MKTPEDYAEELVEKYFELLPVFPFASQTRIYSIACALIDVQNTIDALTPLSVLHVSTEYYQSVKNLLEKR